uniref:Uncharacterized protein n=1 Tax=Odontella aurita TaxID=265563 RepID=A0A7S4MNY4_9STRA|mmetsp:Transcript_27550/g.81053  ORF Transcript_27550/g.81053 Transcript_27550/m.81053 type:complete len:164 (+) Transcript_27550:109-600(+)
MRRRRKAEGLPFFGREQHTTGGVASAADEMTTSGGVGSDETGTGGAASVQPTEFESDASVPLRGEDQRSMSNEAFEDDLDSRERRSVDGAGSEETKDWGGIIASVSNLSIQYNLGVIAPALVLLDPHRGKGKMELGSEDRRGMNAANIRLNCSRAPTPALLNK